MANYGFEAVAMQSMGNAYLNRSGVVTGLQSTDTIPNGGLVQVDLASTIPQTIYNTASPNTQNFTKYTAAGKGAFYVIDACDVPTATDANGQVYRVGSDTTNLSFAYNKYLKFRQLAVDDVFYVYDGNIAATVPTVNQYLVPTASSFAYTQDASAPASGLGLRVEAIEGLTAGLTNKGLKYRCRVVSL